MIYRLLSSWPLLIGDEKINHDNQRYRMHAMSMSVDADTISKSPYLN